MSREPPIGLTIHIDISGFMKGLDKVRAGIGRFGNVVWLRHGDGQMMMKWK